jgi:hypothetical protein
MKIYTAKIEENEIYKASGLLLFAELSQVNDIRPGEKPKEGKLDSILARYSEQILFREIYM